MLSVLATIGKVLGFTLLGILGLVLLILLILLLVPIRYSIDAAGKTPQVRAEGGITWLLHILSARGGYAEKIWYAVKLFGITLLPKKEGSPKKEKKPKKSKKKDIAQETQEMSESEPEPEPGPSVEELIEQIAGGQDTATDTPEPPKETLTEKINGKIRRLKEEAPKKAAAAREKYASLQARADQGIAFVEDAENQKAFGLIKRQLLYLLRHYKPRKLTGWLRLGLSDPATTGQILGLYYGLLCRGYGHFRLYGEFEEEVIEGEFTMKGRIRLVHVVVAGVKLILNRQVRSWLKHKEEK